MECGVLILEEKNYLSDLNLDQTQELALSLSGRLVRRVHAQMLNALSKDISNPNDIFDLLNKDRDMVLQPIIDFLQSDQLAPLQSRRQALLQAIMDIRHSGEATSLIIRDEFLEKIHEAKQIQISKARSLRNENIEKKREEVLKKIGKGTHPEVARMMAQRAIDIELLRPAHLRPTLKPNIDITQEQTLQALTGAAQFVLRQAAHQLSLINLWSKHNGSPRPTSM